MTATADSPPAAWIWIFQPSTPAVSDGTRLFIGGIDQRMYAYFPDQDFETWKTRTTGQIVGRAGGAREPRLFCQ